MSLKKLQRSLVAEAARRRRDVDEVVRRLATFRAQRLSGPVSDEFEDDVLGRLSAALSRLSAAADLVGRIAFRSRGLLEQFAARGPVVTSPIPPVAFDEAVRDLESRDPLGAAELRRAGLEVEDVYGGFLQPDGLVFYPHGFALARAVDIEVTKAVQERLVSGLAKGEATPKIVLDVSRGWDWPSAYAETVTRTTIATATSAGRFREAERVHASGIPVGLRFETAGDSNVRSGRPQDNGENHAALDGLVARVDDPVWDSWSPPLGFSCRCAAVPVMGDDVPDGFVSVPGGAAKHPGFGSRPSRSGAYR